MVLQVFSSTQPAVALSQIHEPHDDACVRLLGQAMAGSEGGGFCVWDLQDSFCEVDARLTGECPIFFGVSLDTVDHQVPLAAMDFQLELPPRQGLSQVGHVGGYGGQHRCDGVLEAVTGSLHGMFEGLDSFIDLNQLRQRLIDIGKLGAYRIFYGPFYGCKQFRTDRGGWLHDGVVSISVFQDILSMRDRPVPGVDGGLCLLFRWHLGSLSFKRDDSLQHGRHE